MSRGDADGDNNKRDLKDPKSKNLQNHLDSDSLQKILSIKTKSGVPFKDLNFFVNSIREPLYCVYWRPKDEPRALVQILHGFGGHCSRYDKFANQLCKIGMLVFSHDHYRHGENPGNFDIPDYKQLVADGLQHSVIMKKRHPGLPLYIFGHSMGGAIGIFMATEEPTLFSGVMLSAPYVILNREFTRMKIRMVSMLRFIFPRLPIGKIQNDLETKDQGESAKLLVDPLVYLGPVRLRTGHQLYLMSQDAQAILPQITQPLLILHGDADTVCNISGSYKLYHEARSVDKKLCVFEDAGHALLFEIARTPGKLTDEVKNWLNEHLEMLKK